MVADMVAFVASQFTTSTWDVGAQELCSVVLITLKHLTHEASTRPPEINPKGAPRESEFYPSPICCLRRNEGQPKLTLSPSSMNKFLRTTN